MEGRVPFAEIARSHQPVLLAIAQRLCGDPAEARDLVQDTFERGLKGFARFTSGTNERAWLVTILHNLFITRCRARAARKSDALTPELEEKLAVPEPEPDPFWATITSEQVEAALEKIPGEFSAVYRLHALEGRSYTEISTALGIPKNTVGTRLSRARQRLREVLSPPAGRAAR